MDSGSRAARRETINTTLSARPGARTFASHCFGVSFFVVQGDAQGDVRHREFVTGVLQPHRVVEKAREVSRALVFRVRDFG